jgi:hypothetical protein
MRKLLPLLLLLTIYLGGCEKKKPVAAPSEPLVPTPRELKTLRAFQLEPESEKGQRKIYELRKIEARIAEARAEVDKWAEIARQKREQEARDAAAAEMP